MTKLELVRSVAKASGCTQKEVSAVIDAMQGVVKDAVANGDKVVVPGFITFDKKHIPAKSGTAVLTGTPTEWTSEAKDVITAKLSKAYRQL